MNAVEALKKVEEYAVTIKNNDPVVYEEFPINAIHWQGDVGVWRIEKLPKYAEEIKNPNAQLAPGTSKGSRHIVKSSDMNHITFYRNKDRTVLEGDILDCKKAVEITHPEHGNVTVPEGIYTIVYQRAYAEEFRRIAD